MCYAVTLNIKSLHEYGVDKDGEISKCGDDQGRDGERSRLYCVDVVRTHPRFVARNGLSMSGLHHLFFFGIRYSVQLQCIED